ncbi:hypothetical protein D3C73_1277830 [compost metagenome]
MIGGALNIGVEVSGNMFHVMADIVKDRLSIAVFLHCCNHARNIGRSGLYSPRMTRFIIDFKSDDIWILQIGLASIRVDMAQQLSDIPLLSSNSLGVGMYLAFIIVVGECIRIFISFRITVAKIGHARNQDTDPFLLELKK